jgi:hypothetical protein
MMRQRQTRISDEAKRKLHLFNREQTDWWVILPGGARFTGSLKEIQELAEKYRGK